MEQDDIKEIVERGSHYIRHTNVYRKSFSITKAQEFFHCAILHTEGYTLETVSVSGV
jgi:hypothetical protein